MIRSFCGSGCAGKTKPLLRDASWHGKHLHWLSGAVSYGKAWKPKLKQLKRARRSRLSRRMTATAAAAPTGPGSGGKLLGPGSGRARLGETLQISGRALTGGVVEAGMPRQRRPNTNGRAKVGGQSGRQSADRRNSGSTTEPEPHSESQDLWENDHGANEEEGASHSTSSAKAPRQTLKAPDSLQRLLNHLYQELEPLEFLRIFQTLEDFYKNFKRPRGQEFTAFDTSFRAQLQRLEEIGAGLSGTTKAFWFLEKAGISPELRSRWWRQREGCMTTPSCGPRWLPSSRMSARSALTTTSRR